MRSIRSIAAWPVYLLLAGLLGSCTSYREVVFKGVEGVQLARMDGRGLALTAQVVVENPNNYRIHVVDPDVEVYLNDLYMGKARLDEKVTLQRRSTATYAVPMNVEFSGQGGSPLVALMGAALAGKGKLKVTGTVRGRVGLIGRRFPFEEEHIIDLRP